MKNGISIFCFAATLLLPGGCKKALKNVEDYFPKVKTVSAELQPDGSVKVTGMVESEGDAPLEYVGGSFSSNSTFSIRENQLISNVLGTNFSVTYPPSIFSSDSVYYFKAWATNGHGWAQGNAIKVEGIIAEPVTPACTLTMNTVELASTQPTFNYSSISSIDEYMGEYSFTGSTSSGPLVNFKFGSPITTGVFTTTTNSSPDASQAYIYFYSGFISGTLSAGSNVYVNKIGTGVYDITICDAPWTYSGSSFYFNTRFTVSY